MMRNRKKTIQEKYLVNFNNYINLPSILYLKMEEKDVRTKKYIIYKG